jgi:hypothetical protein
MDSMGEFIFVVMCSIVLYFVEYLVSSFYVVVVCSMVTGSSSLDLQDYLSGDGLIVVIIGYVIVGLHLLLSLIKGVTGYPIIPNIIIDRGFEPYQRLVRVYTSAGSFDAIENVHSHDIKIGAFILIVMFAPLFLLI